MGDSKASCTWRWHLAIRNAQAGVKMKITEIGKKGPVSQRQLGLFVGNLEQAFSWYTGKELTGINVKKRKEDWLMIINAANSETKLVAFIDGPDHLTLWRTLYLHLSSNRLKFKPSKF